jgi:hypothetical protein
MLQHGGMFRTFPFPYSLVRKDDLTEVKEHLVKHRSLRNFSLDEEEEELEVRVLKELHPEKQTPPRKLYAAEEKITDIMDLQVDEILNPKFRVIVTTTIKSEMLRDMLFNGKFGLPGSMSDFVVRDFH